MLKTVQKLYAMVKISKASNTGFRRIRGDMTEMYKILTGKQDVTVVPKLQLATSSAMGGKFHKFATLRSK